MIDWSPLRMALKRCRNANLPLPIWWRDDDAIEPTFALDQLSGLSEKLGIPVHLAIIPQPAHDRLVPYVNDRPNVIPCVHGWTHENTAPFDAKKSEFGVPREGATNELKLALGRMQLLFDSTLLPLFVPPWNRMDKSFASTLTHYGYSGFSTFGPRPNSGDISQVNTHIDPIYWRGHRGLVEPNDLITQAADILNARCDGTQDTIEPLGLLTHHLVHVPEVWDFSTAFISEMLGGGAHPANLKEILI